MEGVLPRNLERKDLDIKCPRKIRDRIADNIIDEWYLVGRELDVSDQKLKLIHRDSSLTLPEEKAVAVLDAWAEEHGSRATCLRLAEALYGRQKTRVIEILCDEVTQMKCDATMSGAGAAVSPKPLDNQQEEEEIPLYKPQSQCVVDFDNRKVHKLHSFANYVEIIIHTVNDKESLAVLSIMKSPNKAFNLPVNFDTSAPYKFVLGMFGGYKAAQVKTRMGDQCDEVIAEAVEKFPNVHTILAVGVGFAKSKGKFRYGDVMVSKHIHGVQNTKKTSERLMIRPNPIRTVQVDDDLCFTFTNVPTDWKKFQCNKTDDDTKKRFAVVHCGGIISAPTLTASESYRDQLFENECEAIGGEMEGSCVLKFRNKFEKNHPKRKLGFIIIKGVADFADDKKGEGKAWQFTAAKAAASYADHKLTLTKGKYSGRKSVDMEILGKCGGSGAVVGVIIMFIVAFVAYVATYYTSN